MISLGLERQVPVVGTLTFPHRDSRDFKDQVLLEFARLRVGPLGHTMVERLQYDVPRRAPRETRLASNFRRRVSPRDAVTERVSVREESRHKTASERASERTERNGARSRPNWLVLRAPRMPRGPAGSGTLWLGWGG